MKVASPTGRDEIKAQADAGRPFLLIDVLPAEFYTGLHVGALKLL
jgi:hypothetical protein